MNIIQFGFNVPQGESCEVTVDAMEGIESFVRIILGVNSGGEGMACQIEFFTDTGNLKIVGLSSVSSYGACVLACGAGILVKEILDCWRSGAKTKKKMIECLKKKGKVLKGEIAACAIACLAS